GLAAGHRRGGAPGTFPDPGGQRRRGDNPADGGPHQGPLPARRVRFPVAPAPERLTWRDAVSIATTLGAFLEERARSTGKAPFALFADAAPLSAAELLDLADRTAAHLAHGHGIGPGSRVVILSRIGPGQLAALAACWRLGAVACPLEAFLHPQRFAQILRVLRP